MTLCAYINPYGFPTLISDLVVTTVGADKVITPSNLGKVRASDGYAPVSLTRKSFMLNEGAAAFALAGEQNAILDFADYFPLQYRHGISARPMRLAGDLANSFNENLGRNAISLMGFAWHSTDDAMRYVNVQAGLRRQGVRTAHFNEAFATGSGATEFLQFVSRYDAMLAHPSWSAAASRHHLVGFIGALNSEKLFVDSGDCQRDTWGGYFESITLPHDGGYATQMPWSHLGFETFEDRGRRIFRQIGKQFHYHPSPEGGALGIRLEDKNGILQEVVWHIAPFFPSEIRDGSGVSFSSYWPDFVTIFLYDQETKLYLHRTLNNDEVSALERRGDLYFSVPENLLEKIDQAARS